MPWKRLETTELDDLNPIVTGHRIVRSVMYLSLVVAGIAVFFIDLAFFDNVVNLTVAIVGIFLVVGGLISEAGHLLKIISVERWGYPLLLAAMTALTTILFLEAKDNAARTFIGLLVLSLTLGLYGRWRDLGTLSKLRQVIATEYPSDEPH